MQNMPIVCTIALAQLVTIRTKYQIGRKLPMLVDRPAAGELVLAKVLVSHHASRIFHVLRIDEREEHVVDMNAMLLLEDIQRNVLQM